MKIVATIYVILSLCSCPIHHLCFVDSLTSLLEGAGWAPLRADYAPHVAVLGVLLDPVCAEGFAD